MPPSGPLYLRCVLVGGPFHEADIQLDWGYAHSGFYLEEYGHPAGYRYVYTYMDPERGVPLPVLQWNAPHLSLIYPVPAVPERLPA